LSRPRLWKAGKARQVSPGDLVFLALTLLLVCTTFAVEHGLFLQLTDARGSERAGRDSIVDVRCLREGNIEIQGRPASIDMVRPAIERALGTDDRAVVVLDAARGASCALVVEMLDQVRLAGAPRVVLRERDR
jgi:biopolymer transport protein ExbD